MDKLNSTQFISAVDNPNVNVMVHDAIGAARSEQIVSTYKQDERDEFQISLKE